MPFWTYKLFNSSLRTDSPVRSSGDAMLLWPSNSCTPSDQLPGQSPRGFNTPPGLFVRNLPVDSPWLSTSICIPLRLKQPCSSTTSGG